MSIAKHRELLVMSMLRAHPMHGYALLDVLDAGLGPALGLGRAAVYAILRRLSERGWIEGESERSGAYPERSVYSVTPAGEAALPNLVAACAKTGSHTVTPLAAVLSQLEVLSATEQRRALDELIRSRRAHRASIEPFLGHEGLAGAAFQIRAAHLDAEIDLLEEQLAAIRS